MPEVVIDDSSTRGLLRMAAEEGMLRDRRDYGDKPLYSIMQRSLPNWHRQQILEQVILNSKIHTVGRVPLDWMEGDFLNLNLLITAEAKDVSDYEGDQFSPEIIEGMLRASGYDRSFDEWLGLFHAANAVLTEVKSFEEAHPGESFDAFSIIIRGTVDRDFRHSEHYKLAQRWNTAYGDVRPLMAAFEEYIWLSEYASSTACHLRTPVYRLSPDLFNLSTRPHIDGEAVQIYRIATEKLGVLPSCSGLAQAIRLSQHPDSIAFREQIDRWVESLRNTSADKTQAIQEDIRKATESLLKAEGLRKAGFVTGVISIPVSVAGLLNPFIGALGLALTCVGVLFDRAGARQADRLRWVGFGTAAM